MRVVHLLLIAAIVVGCAAERRPSSPHTVVAGVPVSPDECRKILEDAKATPGAVVDVTGPLIGSVEIDSPPDQRAMYLFTLPAHPAHPAFIKAVPDPTSTDRTILTGGYAGSKVEYAKLFSQLAERLNIGTSSPEPGR
jgi:hypothetical protein